MLVQGYMGIWEEIWKFGEKQIEEINKQRKN